MANIIKCPHCGKEIQLDESNYNALLNNIAKEEIEKRVLEQQKLIEEKCKAQYESKLAQEQNKQGSTIQELNHQIDLLKQQLASSNKDADLAVSDAVAKEQAKIAELNKTIALLQEQLKNADKDTTLAVNEALDKSKEELANKEKELIQLKADMESAKKDALLASQTMKEQYDFQLKAKEEEIERWKSFRMGDSTKDLGESLEQYCHDAFDEIRATAFPRASFEKDNKVVDGSKGDFIFQDYDEDGIEVVSIMFEMKNQKDTTATKHKNEHFFKELAKDRNAKGCEYAVLVSTLEEDSKLYNSGIVDVSHKYPKMYVVRPQNFLAIIGLIRNMALKNMSYKKQIVMYEKENIDVINFEKAVQAVAKKISDDYENASNLYDKVEKMCDDMIKKLQDFKEVFRLGKKWIGVAQNQLPDLEVRKLTKNNPTMQAKFDEAHKDDKK